MKNRLILLLIIAILSPLSLAISQVARSPYPIIFIHGLNSNYRTWGVNDGNFDDVIDYLVGAGMKSGGNYNVTLDYLRSPTTLNNSIAEDVHLFPSLTQKGDFYTINFDVHSSGIVPGDIPGYFFSEINVTSDVSKTQTEIGVTIPAKFIVGDIIRIGNEFMEVTGINQTSINVNRQLLESEPETHILGDAVINLSNESNQSAIVKQGKGLQLVIDDIKLKTGATKVILFGHSMGGLCAREYLRSYYKNDIAKLITIGTPHFGSNITNAPEIALNLKGIDQYSDAVRDLRNTYFLTNIPGIYLFGGNEADVKGFYSKDINCNSDPTNDITGLNEAGLYSNIKYTWITSNVLTLPYPGDFLVPLTSQYISTLGDTLLTDKLHWKETKDYFALLRGLDEPSEKKLAYEILENDTIAGFITHRSYYDSLDIDLFKINITSKSTLKINIEGKDSTGIFIFKLLDSNLAGIASETNINNSIEFNLPSGTYYIEIRGTATSSSFKFPYKLITKTTPIPIPTLISIPEAKLNFYDVVVNNSKDKIITIKNNSPSFIFISAFNISDNTQFEVLTPLPINIPSGQSIDLEVRYKPLSIGEKAGILTVVNNSLDVPNLAISLFGKGVINPTKTLLIDPDISYNFGNVDLSENDTKEFNLQNIGSDDVTVSEISLTGLNQNQYSITTPLSIPFNLTSGESKTITVKFQPTSIGTKQAGLQVVNNSDNGSPNHTINLYGNGLDNVYIGGSSFITAYEYWFDDNYAGKVSEITLPKSTLLLNKLVNTNSLNTGLHILHIRFKDEKSLWSSVTSQHFYKFPASNFIDSKIVSFEYWFDNDYAHKISTSEAPQNTLQLISDIETKTLAQGLHIFHSRFKDAKSLWSSVLSQHFYKSKNNLAYPNFVNGYRYWIDLDTSKVVNVTIPVTSNPRYLLTDLNLANLDTGTHLITLQFRDLNGLYSHVISDTFHQLGKPRLDYILPNKGGNTGDVTVNIYGTGFYAGTKVKLTRSGFSDIFAIDSLIRIKNGQIITATFNLRNKDTGIYNLVVSVPNDTIMTLLNGFKIETGIPAAPYVEILGSTLIRPGQWQNYTINYGNSGNIDARGVMLFVAVSDTTADISMLFKVVGPENDSINYTALPISFVIDTLWGEIHYYRVFPLMVSVIPSNSSQTFNFKIKVNSSDSQINLKTWIFNPLYGSPLIDSRFECIHKAVGLAINFIPAYGCLYSLFDNIALPFIENYYLPDEYSYSAASVIQDVSKTIIGCVPGSSFFVVGVKAITKIIGVTKNGSGFIDDCVPLIEDFLIKNAPVRIVRSFDPNEKIGPSGSSLNQFVSKDIPMSYLINFENISTASASAQSVCIIDTLDKSVVDLSSLELGFIRIMDTILLNPPGTKSFSKLLDLRPKNDLIVKIEGGLNEIIGVLKWTFTSLDPLTLLPTTNPLTGFLPPNLTAPEGEGGVFYSIRVKDGIANNTIVKNKACIIFDNNPSICTNTWKNTIDNIKPNSYVKSLPPILSDSTFKIYWTGIDTSSGIKDYSIYYRVNNGGYNPWLVHTSDTSALFYGRRDSSYYFYSIAYDSVGNIEDEPLFYDAYTKISCISFVLACPSNTTRIPSINKCNYTVVGNEFDPTITNDKCIASKKYILTGATSYSGSNSLNDAQLEVGITLIKWIIEDAIGKKDSCVFSVSVESITKPIISINGSGTFCQGTSLSLTASNAVSYKWNNGKTTQTIVENNSGTFTVTVTDINGCTSVSNPVSITAILNPVINFGIVAKSPLNITGTCSVLLNAGNPGSTYSWNTSQTVQSIVVNQSGTFTVTVTNSSGCSSSNSVKVTITDNIKPTVKTKNNILSLDSTGNATLTIKLINNGTTDNCEIKSLTLDKTKFTCDNIGANVVTLTVTDYNGNVGTGTAIITIIDPMPPTIVCPPNVSYNAKLASCPVSSTGIPLGNPTITDNCLLTAILKNDKPDRFSWGTTVIKYTVTDKNGNSVTCSQEVTVSNITCGLPLSHRGLDFTSTSYRFKWTAVSCSSGYEARIRRQIAVNLYTSWSSWTNVTGPGEIHNFTGLMSSSSYNYQLRSKCGPTYSLEVNGYFNTLKSQSATSRIRGIKDDMISQSGFVVIPNPVDNTFKIEMEGFEEEVQVSIFNLLGVPILDTWMLSTDNTLFFNADEMNLEEGTYFIKVSDSLHFKVSKFIRQKTRY